MRPSEAFRLLPRNVRVKALRAAAPAMLRLWLAQNEVLRGIALERDDKPTLRLIDAFIADLKAALLGSIRA